MNLGSGTDLAKGGSGTEGTFDRAAHIRQLREQDVIKAAELFVDNTRAEYDEVKDSDSMSIPAEFMILVQAVDLLRATRNEGAGI